MRAPLYHPSSSWVGLLVGLVLGFTGPGLVQAQVLRGQVRSPDRVLLPGVNVYLPELERGAVTDESGRYLIDHLPAGTYVVQFRFVGYRTEIQTVTLTGETTLDIVLAPETLELDEALVTAGAEAQLNESTLSVVTVDAKKLDRLRGQTLGETLDDLPGITTLTTGPSIAKPVVRGLHSQRVVVLNAGVPQEGQQWGGEHAPEIDPFAPARIEVVKGAAGVEYGVGAIGGVIRVEPRELPATPLLAGRIMLNAFSNNRQGAGSALVEGGSRRWPGVGWRVQGSFRKAGDTRTSDYVVGNSAFEEFDGSLALGYHADRLGLDAYYSHFGTELGLFTGAHIGNADDLQRAIERGEPSVTYDFSYAIDAPKQTIRHDLVTLRGHYVLTGGARLEAQYGLQVNTRKEFDAHRRFSDPLDEPAFALTLTTHTLGVKLRTQPRGRFFGVVGVSGMNQGNVNGESGHLIPNFRALTGGAFARGTWVSGPWTLEAGTRLDHRWMKAFPEESREVGYIRRTHDYTSLSGVAGAIWQFAPRWSLAANLGTAWRPPGVNELYNFGVHHGTAQFEIGDASLGGERSYNVDATLRHVGARTRLEVSLFQNWMQGYIYLYPQPEPTVTIRGTFPTFRYVQTDARLHGVEGTFDVDLADFLAVGVTASVLRGDDRTADLPLLGMPSDRMALRAALALPDAGPLTVGELDVETRFVRRQTHFPEGVDFTDPPPGYVLVGVGYHTDLYWGTVPIRLGLSVDNLFNTSYRDYLSRFRYFIDDPGRNVVLRVRVPLGAGVEA